MTASEKLKLVAEKAASDKKRKDKAKAAQTKEFEKMTTAEKLAYIAAYLGIE